MLSDQQGRDAGRGPDLSSEVTLHGSTDHEPPSMHVEKGVLPDGGTIQAPSTEATIVVDWDGPDDPANPINFSPARKWFILSVIGTSCFAVTCASSMVAATYPGMQAEFGIDLEVATLGITLFVAGLGIGPLFLAPLSEFYGRSPIYLWGYFFYSALSFLSAFGNLPGFMIGRFLQGLAGSAFLSVTGGSVTDMWIGARVSRPMALYSACPFLGPAFGPLVAAFINTRVNWRWTWYVCTMWSWVELLLLALFVPETYAPKLLRNKARRLRAETGNAKLRSQREIIESQMGIRKIRHVYNGLGRPFEILLKEPMAFLLCLWCSLLLGILYLFFASFLIIFGGKGFNSDQIGLSFVGVAVGILLASIINATYFSALYQKKAKQLGCKPPPEEHLKKGMVAAILGPVSLFWFAWTSQSSVHWAAAELATVPFGMAFTFGMTASFTYLVDAFRPYAASAMGANSFMRSSFAAVFPLFAPKLYSALGVTWAGTLIACLLLALSPCPFLFYKYGARLRATSKFSDHASP